MLVSPSNGKIKLERRLVWTLRCGFGGLGWFFALFVSVCDKGVSRFAFKLLILGTPGWLGPLTTWLPHSGHTMLLGRVAQDDITSDSS